MDDATTLVAGDSGTTTVTEAPWHGVPPTTTFPPAQAEDDDVTVPGTVAAATGTVSTDGRVVVLDAGREVTFGRAATTRLRIGHAPVHDDVVPTMAGKVFVHDGRVVVANLHDVLALDIRVEGRPLISVAPGDWHSPRERNYDVLVTGTYTYELAVTIDTSSDPTHAVGPEVLDDPRPPSGARPRLTERHRRILDAYVAPLADGAPPASHQQVAETVGISRSLVRLECHKIWNELLVAGVPMRPLGDARDEVADAWARHRF
jgi:hypothetical protein